MDLRFETPEKKMTLHPIIKIKKKNTYQYEPTNI